MTHLIHWLLVYLGVFNEFIWFRFKAGHSNTEVADRLFSIIKSLFESDGAHRVLPIDDFPSLIPKIEAAFKNEVESCTFNWNFANWDLRNMMDNMKVVSSSSKESAVRWSIDTLMISSLWNMAVSVCNTRPTTLGRTPLEKRSGRPLCEWIGR